MRLAMRLPPKKGDDGIANDVDPRESEDAEIIDLASRNAFPAVTQRKGAKDGLGLAAGVAVVALLGAVTLWGMNSARMAPPESVGGQQVAQPAIQPSEVAPAVPAAAVTPVDQAQSIQPTRMDPAPQPVLAAAPGAMVNPYASPTLLHDFSTATSPPTGFAPVGGVAADGNAGPTSVGGSAGDFAAKIGGVGGGPATAQIMIDPATTVTKGTLIPAVLETAIDTDVPGFVRAVVSQDVRSHDGKHVLVPRSSRLIGQYQSGVQGGQKRAYVIWTDLITPQGASVKIGSPAVGFDGTTGLQGKVNSHFFKRFGSAMLLSVVGGLSAIGTGGASVVLGGAGQSAASVAAQQDSQIGPTIRVSAGAPIRVFTARDLDFSQVANQR